MDSYTRAQNLVDKIKVLESNPHYRIADVFYMRGWRYRDSAIQVCKEPAFSDSILRLYLDSSKNASAPCIVKMQAACSEFLSNNTVEVPQENEVVIHVRAGDVIDNSWFLKTPFIEELKNHPDAQKCTIVTCFAFQEYKERNKWMYSDEKLAENRIQMRGLFIDMMEMFPSLEFDVRSSERQDLDLLYMVHADHFIRDKGGFSDLVCDLRQFKLTGQLVSLENLTESELLQREFNRVHDNSLTHGEMMLLVEKLNSVREIELASWLENRIGAASTHD